MDPKTRGWKMLNLALGDSDENNTYTVLNENPNNIEFILELGGGEPMYVRFYFCSNAKA